MKIGKDILYLGDADVVSCECSAAQMNAAMEQVFRDKSAGRAWTARELSMPDGSGNKYAGKGGGLLEPSFASMKWYGYFPQNPARGLNTFNSIIVLNEGGSGLPVAIMNGTWISQVRTASITAVAAKYMARPGSRKVGFIGCGAQARSHLNALAVYLGIDEVSAYSRTLASAERFAEEARQRGLKATAHADPRTAIAGCDLVITTVPRLSANNMFLDAAWVEPGTFVGAMDLGFSWNTESLLTLDRVITDDIQAVEAGETLRLNYPGKFVAGLAEIVSGSEQGRLSEAERNGIVFAGTGLADTAAAVLIYQLALAKGIGTVLSL